MILLEQVKAFAEIAPKREQFPLVRMTSCERFKSVFGQLSRKYLNGNMPLARCANLDGEPVDLFDPFIGDGNASDGHAQARNQWASWAELIRHGQESFRRSGLHADYPPSASVAGRKSEQAKDGFDGNPRGHCMLCCVSPRSKSPAAHGLRGTLVQAKTNTFDDADILRPSIRAHENL